MLLKLKQTAMANLKDAVDLTNTLLRERGLYTQGWRVKLTRAKFRAGNCNHRTKQIGLSVLVTPAHTEDAVFDTVTHEVAHALAGPRHGHDMTWKRIHLELGGNAKRCYDDSSYIGGKPPEHLERNLAPRKERAPYKGTCPHGHVSYRFKLKRGARYSCSVCHRGSFDPKFIIAFTHNTDKS